MFELQVIARKIERRAVYMFPRLIMQSKDGHVHICDQLLTALSNTYRILSLVRDPRDSGIDPSRLLLSRYVLASK